MVTRFRSIYFLGVLTLVRLILHRWPLVEMIAKSSFGLLLNDIQLALLKQKQTSAL